LAAAGISAAGRAAGEEGAARLSGASAEHPHIRHNKLNPIIKRMFITAPEQMSSPHKADGADPCQAAPGAVCSIGRNQSKI
jgi:hypothetical protein